MCHNKAGDSFFRFLMLIAGSLFVSTSITFFMLMNNSSKQLVKEMGELHLSLKQEFTPPLITDLKIIAANESCKEMFGKDAFEPFVKVFPGIVTTWNPYNNTKN